MNITLEILLAFVGTECSLAHPEIVKQNSHFATVMLLCLCYLALTACIFLLVTFAWFYYSPVNLLCRPAPPYRNTALPIL